MHQGLKPASLCLLPDICGELVPPLATPTGLVVPVSFMVLRAGTRVFHSYGDAVIR